MKFSVLGGQGFIGRNLVAYLQASGHEVYVPPRGAEAMSDHHLGHAIFAIGVTADFRHRPFDTVRANVGVLADVLENSRFDSLLYLSSTRVYAGAPSGNEGATLAAGDLYNLSKLTGEELCHGSGRLNVRVARLSNVFGNDFSSENFLPSVIRAALRDGCVRLESAMESSRDYVDIKDVVSLLPRIALGGSERLYNVASGESTSNQDLLKRVREATGCRVEVSGIAESVRFPRIDIERSRREFGFSPRGVLQCIEELVSNFRTMESSGSQ